MNKACSYDVWNEYLYWYEQGSKNNIKKINRLIKSIDRPPFFWVRKT